MISQVVPSISSGRAALAATLALTFAWCSSLSANPSADADPSHGRTFGGSGVPTIVSTVEPATPGSVLAVGTTTPMVLTLKAKDGKPVVSATDLEVVHHEPIHLLIVDPSLGDYHHLHPPAGSVPGTYTFNFAPRRAGRYHVFSDLHPKATGVQEYSFTTVEVPGEAQPVKKLTDRRVTVDGYTFELSFDDPKLVQGTGTGARVKVTGPDGKPFAALEPLMGAFAHMVGFSEDLAYVAHIHPLGPEPQGKEERGGPELTFHVGINHPGYHVLYVQVQIAGRDVFAPFGVEVAPRPRPTDVSGLMKEVDLAMESLDTVVNFGPLHKVHDKAFAARDLLLLAPEVAKGLPSEASSSLAASLQRVRSLAALLDKYGDNKQQKEAQAILPRLKNEVLSIHSLLGTKPTLSEAKPLGNALCPVSGAKVGSMQAGSHLIHNGWKIGLCCDGCATAFHKDPEAGLRKAQESASK